MSSKDNKVFTPNKSQTIASLTKQDQNAQATYATLASPQIPQMIEMINTAPNSSNNPSTYSYDQENIRILQTLNGQIINGTVPNDINFRLNNQNSSIDLGSNLQIVKIVDSPMVEQVKAEPKHRNPKPPKRPKQTIANLTKQENLNILNAQQAALSAGSASTNTTKTNIASTTTTTTTTTSSTPAAALVQATPVTIVPSGQVILAQPLTTAAVNTSSCNPSTPVMTTLKLTNQSIEQTPISTTKKEVKEKKQKSHPNHHQHQPQRQQEHTAALHHQPTANVQLQNKRNKQQRLFNTFVRESICQLLGPDYMKTHDVQDIDPQLMEMIRKEAVENYLPENIRPRRAWHLAKASLRTLKRTLNNKKT